jgi:hypothetical protein
MYCHVDIALVRIYPTFLHNLTSLVLLFERTKSFVGPVFLRRLCAEGWCAYKILTAASSASEPVKILPKTSRLTLFMPLIIITTTENLSFELRERYAKGIGYRGKTAAPPDGCFRWQGASATADLVDAPSWPLSS